MRFKPPRKVVYGGSQKAVHGSSIAATASEMWGADFDWLDGRPHCDDYIDDETQPEALRKWLDYKRATAVFQYEHPEQETTLYASTTAAVINLPVGTRVRLTMASRMGDVGISRDLTKQNGYEVRVTLDTLENFSATA